MTSSSPCWNPPGSWKKTEEEEGEIERKEEEEEAAVGEQEKYGCFVVVAVVV